MPIPASTTTVGLTRRSCLGCCSKSSRMDSKVLGSEHIPWVYLGGLGKSLLVQYHGQGHKRPIAAFFLGSASLGFLGTGIALEVRIGEIVEKDLFSQAEKLPSPFRQRLLNGLFFGNRPIDGSRSLLKSRSSAAFRMPARPRFRLPRSTHLPISGN